MIKLYAVECNYRGEIELLSKKGGGKYFSTKGHAQRLADAINEKRLANVEAKVLTFYVFTADELANLGVKVDE